MSRQPFDIAKALPAAWDRLWADCLARQAEGANYRGQATYLTATDLERQVRAFAQDQADGKPWGTTPAYGLTVVRIGGAGPGGLLQACRAWLLAQTRAGRLEAMNHGRGHVSGMRFAPVGSGLDAAEEQAEAAREERNLKPRPVHVSRNGRYGGRALCVPRPAGYFGRPSKTTLTTGERERVTCPRCLNLLASGTPMPVKVLYAGEEE